MATATAEPEVAPAPAPGVLLKKYTSAKKWLNANAVEMDEPIELLMLMALAQTDGIFLGDAGVGKTMIIELLTNHAFKDMTLFTHMFGNAQNPAEVLGPEDFQAYKRGEITRLTAGFQPDANLGYWDEVFKAPAPMLNPMLTLMADRLVKEGGKIKKCDQLLVILMSSNELPSDDRLYAFRDRVNLTFKVEPVRTPEGRKKVSRMQLDRQSRGLDTTGLEPLTLADVQAIKGEVDLIEVPDALVEAMEEAQAKWLEKDLRPSERRKGAMWRMVRAHAWAHGRSVASTDDLLPCQHMAFNEMDDYPKAREVIVELASEFTRRTERLRQTVESTLAEIDKVKSEIEALPEGDERDKAGVASADKVAALRTLKRETDKAIKEGASKGQDVTVLEDSRSKIERQQKWLAMEIYGVTEDD